MSGKGCWGVGGSDGNCGKRYGGGKERCVGSGEVWESVLTCGERMWGEEWEKCREMCWGVEPQHTSTHLLPHLTFPYISPYLPTPQHTFLHLLSYLFPHLPFLPPHPNTNFYDLHISLHLLKVWQSYHVTKFLWRSYCGEVTGNQFN